MPILWKRIRTWSDILHELWAEAGRVRTVRFMFAEENRGKEIKERIQKDLKQYKKAVILTGMILGTMQILFQTVCPMRILFGIPCPGCGLTHAGWYVITFQWKKAWQWDQQFSYGFSVWEAGVSFAM